MFRRSGKSGGWSRFFNIDDLHPCPILEAPDNLPLVGNAFKFYRQNFPNLPQKCPIEKGDYKFELVSEEKKNESQNFFALKFTQGFYRYIFKLSTTEDKDFFILYWIMQIID